MSRVIELRFFWDEEKTPVHVLEIAEDGQVKSSRRFADNYPPAYAAFHKAAARAQREGYRLVIDNVVVNDSSTTDDVVFESTTDLESATIEEPSDNETWSVLVDAWLEAGDPRGILASIAATQVTDPREFLQRRQATDQARRQAIGALYGPLGVDGYRAFPKFKRGLVSEIRFDVEEGVTGRPVAELVSLMLSHPMCRFVDTLSIDGPFSQVHEALIRSRPIALRNLKFHSSTAIEISDLAKTTPNLETLELRLSDGAYLNVHQKFALARLKKLVVFAKLSFDSLRFLLASLALTTSDASIEVYDSAHEAEHEELVSSWLNELVVGPLSFRYNNQRVSSELGQS